MMAHTRYALALMLTAGLATPASAATAPKTWLAKCGEQSCLVVAGTRDNSESSVRINGHEVKPDGGRRWRVRMPVSTARAWSEPYARTITVSVAGTLKDAKLPIGMMGHADLAMLVVRVK